MLLLETFNTYKEDLLKAFIETLDMVLSSFIISFAIGIILAIILYISSPNGIKKNRYVYFIISSFINITRSVPFILFIIVLIPFNRLLVGTGFGVNASKVPLTLIGTATFARLLEQSFTDVRKELYETSYTLGASKYQFFTNFLLPEARSSIVLNATSMLISLISYSTVMGTIGGGGLGDLAISEGFGNFKYQLMWIIIIIMILLVILVQTIGNIISRKLDKR